MIGVALLAQRDYGAIAGGVHHEYAYKYVDPDGRFAFLLPLVPYIATATVAVVGHYALPGRQGRENTVRAVANAIRSDKADAPKSDGKKDTLQPGPHAGDSIPARGPDRDFDKGSAARLMKLGGNPDVTLAGQRTPAHQVATLFPIINRLMPLIQTVARSSCFRIASLAVGYKVVRFEGSKQGYRNRLSPWMGKKLLQIKSNL